MEFEQIVKVQAYNDAEISRKVRMIRRIAAEPIDGDGQPDKPTDQLPPPTLPAPVPYFDVGNAIGKAGETVEILVEAYCPDPMTGFHIGGGVGLTSEPRSGYGKFRALGATLGPYLRRYLKDEGATHNEPNHVHDHFFSIFNFYDWEVGKAYPEEWWEFVVGMFSIDQARTLEAIQIPSGTHLFTLRIEILDGTPAGEYELTCLDEHYYTHERYRRRKFEFSGPGKGFTKIETFPGKITVR